MRKLMLLAATAVAAMALMAPSAMAQESPVEVSEENAGHCVPDCEITATGQSQLRIEGTETVVSACQDTFTANIGENGAGEVFDAHLEDVQPDSCNSVPCEPTDWGFSLGETGPGVEHLVIEFCLTAAPEPCEVEVDVVETAPHEYTLVANNEHCGNFALDGAWTIGSGQIEVEHP